MKKRFKPIIALSVVAFIVIAWILVSPLFLDKTVNEDFPIESSQENVSEEMQNLMVDYLGNFVNADSFHRTSGVAKIISESDRKYLRLEGFETTNGPDLYIYVASDTRAEEYVNLGRLKGNIGNQNYEITEEIDFEKYNKVLIWCKAFGVLFGSADLEQS